MSIRKIILPDIGPVTIYKRRGNRSLRLSIGSNGEIRVSMPAWLPYKAGEQFALTKTSWIVANRKPTAPALKHGQAVGKAHHLFFSADPSAAKVNTRLHQNEVRVTHPPHVTPDDTSVQTAAAKACGRALHKEAEALLPARLKSLALMHGFEYNSLHIKHLKSRWGSCTSAKDITMNDYIMELPWHLIDYVLLHELTHTKVMRHGAPFWQELERHLPRARELRREINHYQPAIAPHNS